jgi:putative restriction endonuclease
MRGYVAPTDHGWYQHLLARPYLEEVNFWLPGGTGFAALRPGEPFFFKLKAPHDAIGGFGQFSRFERLPVWLAWEAFGEANGVDSETALLKRVARLARAPASELRGARPIGCVFIAFPTLFAPERWVPVPRDWKRNIVRGRGYDLSGGEGRRLLEACLRQAVEQAGGDPPIADSFERDRYGRPSLARARLGQQSFRFAVLEAYGQACAVTTEHSLPVLDAAHIKPYRDGGEHAVSNGLSLRRDLHRLFDLGYVTVRKDHTLAVSRALQDEFENGRTYYALEGTPLVLPPAPAQRPDEGLLEWHRDMLFRA